MAQSYHLIREINDFDLLDFDAHLGWISSELLSKRIYTRQSSKHFFLHDENSNRLFEFTAARPESLNSTEKYWEVIHYFKSIVPELFEN